MADDTNNSYPSGHQDGSPPGHRPGGNRDAGGFRIRLSDNEMQAARALQDAFGLRSTVAVLGFSLRTLAQQLEQGQLAELVAQHQAQAASHPQTPRPEGVERRRDRDEGRGRGGATQRAARIDPFARPSKPAPAPVAEPDREPSADSTQGLITSAAVEPDAEPMAAAEAPAEVETAGNDPDGGQAAAASGDSAA